MCYQEAPTGERVRDHTDVQLAELAQSGNRTALEILLKRHQRSVFSVSYRILGNRSDALDATQDALLRVVRHLRSFRPGRPFFPWLRVIAVRAALDQANRMGRDRVDEVPVDTLAHHAPDPLRQACHSEAVERVHRALEMLTPSQRAAFLCKEVEQMDTRETAKAMGCRKATVRWHLFEARKRLAEILGPKTGEAP
jgi:RNA polymerase sigma-70 factor (ECF subfamily)